MNWLIRIDEEILFAINNLHSEAIDVFMTTVTGKFIWIPFYLFLTYILLKEKGVKEGIVYLLFIALMIAAVDQTCSSLVRPTVERLRPSSHLNPISETLHLVEGYRGGSYGFPSAHAANTIALALFMAMVIKRRAIKYILFVWVVLVAYSRVYLGVHYPYDIIAGFIIGAAYALFFSYLARRFTRFTLPLLQPLLPFQRPKEERRY